MQVLVKVLRPEPLSNKVQATGSLLVANDGLAGQLRPGLDGL